MKPPKAHGQKHARALEKAAARRDARGDETGQDVERFTTENQKQNTRRVDKKLQGAA
jgi:hypothetical protein